MRILILNQFFYPDHSATSQLMTELAESLVEAGLEVTAVAGRGLYTGRGRLSNREKYKGTRIERAWSTRFGKRHLAGRLSDYISFYVGAIWKVLTLPRHDIVMALTTPPLISVVALIVGRFRSMRVVTLVQDVYPDVAVALRTVKPGNPIVRILDWLNRFTLRNADRIVVLSECMRDRIAQKTGLEAASRIDIIHNWADGAQITPPGVTPNPFSIKHGLEDSFVVLFSGNLGQVNDFDTVLEAALILRDQPQILFLFIGDGGQASHIGSFAKANKLDNVRLLPYQPREMTRYSIAAGDAALVTLANGLAGLSVPSKLYALLAAGRPILFVGDTGCEPARIITDNGCGAVFKSGDSQELARLIASWAKDKEQLALLGQRARFVFDRRFDRRLAVNAYLATFSKCMACRPNTLLEPVVTQQQD